MTGLWCFTWTKRVRFRGCNGIGAGRNHLGRKYAGQRATMLHPTLFSSTDFSSLLHCRQPERITGTGSSPDRSNPTAGSRIALKRQTHDYKRHGTTALFAAFNSLASSPNASSGTGLHELRTSRCPRDPGRGTGRHGEAIDSPRHRYVLEEDIVLGILLNTLRPNQIERDVVPEFVQ